jgi:hypothetical protein
MSSHNTLKYHKCLSLAEHWYNTTYHSSLKTSPFQALYGYAPILLPTGAPPKSEVETVNQVMQDRHKMLM